MGIRNKFRELKSALIDGSFKRTVSNQVKDHKN